MQARFYAPWYGRFLSPDPARDQHFEETQSWNIYSYVRNQPTMMIDPTGMVTTPPLYDVINDTEYTSAPAFWFPPSPNAVFAWHPGTASSAGWQVPGVEHGDAAKAGFVIKIDKEDGSGTFGTAHATPGSQLAPGTPVKVGDEIGTYADPTNGHSTGAHAHVFETDKDGKMIAPAIDGKVVVRNQKTTTKFGVVDKSHPKPHRGTDLVNPEAKKASQKKEEKKSKPVVKKKKEDEK